MATITTTSSDAGRTFPLSAYDEFIGSPVVDRVTIDANAIGVVVNGGGGTDLITMSGTIASYTAAADGTRLKLSNAVGSTYIPLNPNAQILKFANNSTGVEIKIDATAGKLMLGTQVLTTSAATITGISPSAGKAAFDALSPDVTHDAGVPAADGGNATVHLVGVAADHGILL